MRERSALLLALGLHGLALFASLQSAGAVTAHDVSAVPSSAVTQLVELEAPQVGIQERPTNPAPPVQAPLDALHHASAGALTEDRPTASVAAGPPPRLASAADGWVFDARQRPDLLTLGAPRYRVGLAGSGEAIDTEARRARQPAPGNPFVGSSDRDVALGLGRGGPIVIAVEDAARAADVMGSARFEVTLDSAGEVRVELASSKGDGSAWRALAAPIARLVAAKPVRSGGRGLRVQVEVEATERLADGRDVKSLGTRAGATLGEGGGASGVAMKEMPNVHVEHQGKVCSARLSVDPTGVGLAGACSLENIAVPARRIVAARETSETLL